MMFIQASSPRRRAVGPTALSLSDAIARAFEPVTEYMFIVWNGLPIRIGWSEPFDQLIRSVVPLVGRLLAEQSGRGAYGMHENRLAFEWNVEWADGKLVIESRWSTAPGALEAELGKRSRLEMPIADFVSEWKMPLKIAIEALEGVTIEPDHTGIDKLAELRRVEAAIPRFGSLYAQTAS